jgi:hypothetical protein
MGYFDIDEIRFGSDSAHFFKTVILIGLILFSIYYLVNNYILYLNV